MVGQTTTDTVAGGIVHREGDLAAADVLGLVPGEEDLGGIVLGPAPSLGGDPRPSPVEGPVPSPALSPVLIPVPIPMTDLDPNVRIDPSRRSNRKRNREAFRSQSPGAEAMVIRLFCNHLLQNKAEYFLGI